MIISCDDPAALAWAREFFGPSLPPADDDRPTVLARANAERLAELADRAKRDAVERPCFAFDQSMYRLPTSETLRGVVALDARRSCAFRVSRSEVELVGDPGSRRWRFTLVLIIHELLATRRRRSRLELHAAAVEAGGRAIAIVGPKGAGKTTLSFHLLRSGRCGWLANDRVFAGGEADPIEIEGVPTALKVRPATAAEFPELAAGLPAIERPYLYGEREQPDAGAEPRRSGLLMLSPPQVARRLGATRTASAPLGALLFPEIDAADGWDIDPLPEAEAAERIWGNLFGDAARPRPSTVFEALAGGRSAPDRELADAIAAAAPGFRVRLGRGAYDAPDFAGRLLEEIAPVSESSAQ